MRNISIPHLILASASPERLALLRNVGFIPDFVYPMDINETPVRNEKPRCLALRLASEKCMYCYKKYKPLNSIILSGDTVVARGMIVVDKALDDEDVRSNMRILSGKNHRVYSGFSIIQTDSNGQITRCISSVEETRVKFKSLTTDDIEGLVRSGEGIGKAGGYAILGFGASFVIKIIGQVSTVIAMPLYHVRNTLLSCGAIPFMNQKDIPQ